MVREQFRSVRGVHPHLANDAPAVAHPGQVEIDVAAFEVFIFLGFGL